MTTLLRVVAFAAAAAMLAGCVVYDPYAPPAYGYAPPVAAPEPAPGYYYGPPAYYAPAPSLGFYFGDRGYGHRRHHHRRHHRH